MSGHHDSVGEVHVELQAFNDNDNSDHTGLHRRRSSSNVEGHGAGGLAGPALIRQNTSREVPRAFAELSIRLEESVRRTAGAGASSNIDRVDSLRAIRAGRTEVTGPQAKASAAPEDSPDAESWVASCLRWWKWPIGAKKREAPGKSAMLSAATYVAHEHLLTMDDLVHELEVEIRCPTSPELGPGVSNADAVKRMQANGMNRLTPAKKKSPLLQFLREFTSPFMLLLLVCGALCFATYGIDPNKDKTNIWLGVVLFALVVFTCVVEFYQHHKAAKIMEGFSKLLPQKSRVVREGRPIVIPAEEIVVGDIVLLVAGDKVPADLRVITGQELKVDNSSLTGECEPQPRSGEATSDNPFETENIAFYSTMVTDGTGVGVVIRTGDNTLIGQIAKISSMESNEVTTLDIEIRKFVRVVAVMTLAQAVIFCIVAIIRGRTVTQTMLDVMGILVANVPQGLPATVSTCLVLIARRMAARNVFVKRLSSIETLGSCSVIVSDKTGTITMNKMTAVHAYCNGTVTRIPRFEVTALDAAGTDAGESGVTSGMFLREDNAANGALFRAAALCSRADYEIVDGIRKVVADASETAIFNYTEAVVDTIAMRAAYKKLFEIPFNSKNKFQLSIHAMPTEPSTHLLVFKGAPEILITRCSSVLMASSETPVALGDSERATIQRAVDDLAGCGERVLAFAHRVIDVKHGKEAPYTRTTEGANFPEEGYVFLGLISLIDPPKANVREAIATCRSAGITVIMATGDHPKTAAAIAFDIGLITRAGQETGSSIVVTGTELATMTPEQLNETLKKQEIVFARTTPQQKLLIVEALQRLEKIVAVTGDGVNDSPALKQADIGVAMGISGSDVAKEAADIILMDDSFASIVVGIEQGRLLFANLRKSVAYTVTHLTPEVFPYVLFLLGGFPIALSSFLILFIDLGTELAPAIAFANETAESNIMRVPPRNAKTERMVSTQALTYAYLQFGVLEIIPSMLCFFYVMNAHGFPPNSLPNSAADYFSLTSDDYVVNGITYTAAEQVHALQKAQSACYAAIAMTQIANLFTCKTRRSSLFKHGIMGNKVLLRSILISMAIMVFVVFLPALNDGIGSSPPTPAYMWLMPLPFMVVFFFLFEAKKYGLRHLPTTSWFHRIFFF